MRLVNESLLRVHDHVSQSPPHASKKREIMAGVALILSILGFVLQTELLGKVATLNYQKPMFVMYITHSSMIFLFPLQFLTLWSAKLFQRGESFTVFYKKHTTHLKQTAILVAKINGYHQDRLLKFFLKISCILAIALNVAGASWYIAVNMTTTADLTAIYNCATFFAYGFSILLLKEAINYAKLGSVFLSIIGVFIVAYMGNSENISSESSQEDAHNSWRKRVMGNIIIAFGTILYGLYEVLYKKIACPPQTVSARRQAAFANLIGAGIGIGTFILMLPFLLLMHVTGWEVFELPSAQVTNYILISIAGNVVFSGAFLVLMSLTSPVLGSVSSLLATCVVPLVNFLVWHQMINFAEICGGALIIISFLVMAWASKEDFIEEDEDGEQCD